MVCSKLFDAQRERAWAWAWAWAAVALLSAFFCFGAVPQAGFVWDDYALVDENPFFRSLDVAIEAFLNPLYPFSSSHYFRPVQSLSYMADYAATGGAVWGYRLTNVLLHTGAAWLLFSVLMRVLPGLAGARATAEEKPRGDALLWIAVAVASVWLVHPMHHAAVTYISGRADSLAAVFSLGAWCCLLRMETARRRAAAIALAVAAAVLALLGLFSKEIAMLWMVLAGLHASLFRQAASRFARLGPWLGIGVVAGLCQVQRSIALANVPVVEIAPPGFGSRCWLALRALGDYGQIMLWPGRLHMERRLTPYPTDVGKGTFLETPWLTIFGCAMIALGVFLAVFPGRYLRVRQFGVAWFALGFLPISNLFPLNAQVAEHWIYMPSAGFFLAVIALAFEMPARFHRAVALALGLAGIALGVQAHLQAQVWKDDATFFARTLTDGGDSPRVRSNLASIEMKKGDLVKAERILREAMVRFPGAVNLETNLVHNLIRQKRSPEALEILDSLQARARVVTKVPWDIEMLRAQAETLDGDIEGALARTERLLAQWPGRWDLVRLRNALLHRAGREAEGQALLHSYVAETWWHAEAVRQLAVQCEKAGDWDQAIEKWKILAKLDMRAAEPWQRLAAIYHRRGDLESAAEALVEARSRKQKK
jgi:tetratricopeptide (TPR) repeat protein